MFKQAAFTFYASRPDNTNNHSSRPARARASRQCNAAVAVHPRPQLADRIRLNPAEDMDVPAAHINL